MKSDGIDIGLHQLCLRCLISQQFDEYVTVNKSIRALGITLYHMILYIISCEICLSKGIASWSLLLLIIMDEPADLCSIGISSYNK